jgi:two-component system chemotaxis sensor kinase CheA
MMIEDDELRDIFRTSSEERLQTLDDGLLHLEKHPDDQETIHALMREAHSLKGDSNMLGVPDLGKLAHQVEHILGAVKRGESDLTADVCDRLSHGMMAMKQLVHEAVTGEVTGVNVFYVLAELMGSSAPPTAGSGAKGQGGGGAGSGQGKSSAPPRSTRTPSPSGRASTPATSTRSGGATPEDGRAKSVETGNGQPDLVTIAPAASSDPVGGNGASAAAQSNQYRIETIRVPTHNLDALMTQTGELTVTKIRVAHRLAEIESHHQLVGRVEPGFVHQPLHLP